MLLSSASNTVASGCPVRRRSTRPSPPVPANSVPSAASIRLHTCVGADVSRLVKSGPGETTPSLLTKTPSEVPRRNSAAVAVVQNTGPDAEPARQIVESRNRINSRRTRIKETPVNGTSA